MVAMAPPWNRAGTGVQHNPVRVECYRVWCVCVWYVCVCVWCVLLFVCVCACVHVCVCVCACACMCTCVCACVGVWVVHVYVLPIIPSHVSHTQHSTSLAVLSTNTQPPLLFSPDVRPKSHLPHAVGVEVKLVINDVRKVLQRTTRTLSFRSALEHGLPGFCSSPLPSPHTLPCQSGGTSSTHPPPSPVGDKPSPLPSQTSCIACH